MNTIFQLKRFCNVVKWSTTLDRQHYSKSMWSWIAPTAILMQLPNIIRMASRNAEHEDIVVLTGIAAMLMGTLVLGSSYMHVSFNERKDAFRELFMVPASNLEKFLARYLMAYVMGILFCVVSIIVGDVLQFVVGYIIDREPLEWVVPKVLRAIYNIHSGWNGSLALLVTLYLWIHTYFMLGANFFRNVKYGWAFTMLVVLAIVIAVLMVISSFHDSAYSIGHAVGDLFSTINDNWLLFTIILAALSVFNAVMAYRLFCRRQLFGRFVNL